MGQRNVADGSSLVKCNLTLRVSESYLTTGDTAQPVVLTAVFVRIVTIISSKYSAQIRRSEYSFAISIYSLKS
jgi:hypothetical protein